jgi:hypothetical protein
MCVECVEVRGVFVLVATMWQITDIWLDWTTVLHTYGRADEETDELPPPYFYNLGMLFIFLPTIVATVLVSVQKARGKYDWRQWIAYGPGLVPVTIICQLMTANYMFKWQLDENDEKEVAHLKMLEALLESLPQAILAINYLAWKGWPWNSEASFFDLNPTNEYIPFLSAVFSLGMVMLTLGQALAMGKDAVCLVCTGNRDALSFY